MVEYTGCFSIACGRLVDSIDRPMETMADIRDLPGLGEDSIHIWGVHVPGILDRMALLHGLLSEEEREKAARFYREADRNSSVAARGALRVLLFGYTGKSPAAIDFQYTENGKPHVAGSDVAFNVSHSGDWVVLAFGRNRNIGVDVEKIKREMDVLSVARRYFAPEEQALMEGAKDRHAVFFELWARKEAYVKACGSTLFTELSSFSVPMDEAGERDGWYFRRLEAGAKYAAAVVSDKAPADVPCYDFGKLVWHGQDVANGED